MNDFSNIDNDFIKKNKRIIYAALNRYSNLPDFEDIIQEAYIWAMEAIKKWNKKRASWPTFLYRYVSWKIQRVYLKSKANKYRYYETVELDSASYVFPDLFCSDFLDVDDNCIQYESILSTIKDQRIRDIIIMHCSGYLFKEIGAKYHKSKQWAWLLYRKGIEQIKEKMEVV